MQKLGCEFYCKEHTKPLFDKQGILALPNIYNYRICIEVLKILKFRLPMSLYTSLKLSHRNNRNILLLPSPTTHFIFKGSRIWNIAVKILAINNDLPSIKIGQFKDILKRCLLEMQNMYDDVEWYPKTLKLSLLQTHLMQIINK